MRDDFFPIFAERDEFLDAQLSKIGLTPSDISLVIVSHMHSDHCGGLQFFSNTKAGRKIYVGKKEFEIWSCGDASVVH